MNEFFTWELLATYAGASLATGIITQMIKSLFSKLPTQALAYIVAVAVLLGAQYFTGMLTVSSAALSLLNAILVSAAATGTYDFVKRIGKEVKNV